jgi:hypothetical protein
MVESKGEGRECWQGGFERLLFPSTPTRYDKRSICVKISCWAAKELLVNPLGRFA